MRLPGGDAARHEIGGEALGERRGDGLDQRRLLHQLHVGVAGETDPGSDLGEARGFFAVEPDAFREPEPEREPALPFAIAVVIVDALDPHPAKGRILGLGKDDRVLDGNAALVIVPVLHPRLELFPGQLPLVHAHVEGMVVVVPLLALAGEPGDEVRAGERLPHRAGHSVISIPSHATRQPARSTATRSGESSRKTGLVLLMWM